MAFFVRQLNEDAGGSVAPPRTVESNVRRVPDVLDRGDDRDRQARAAGLPPVGDAALEDRPQLGRGQVVHVRLPVDHNGEDDHRDGVPDQPGITCGRGAVRHGDLHGARWAGQGVQAIERRGTGNRDARVPADVGVRLGDLRRGGREGGGALDDKRCPLRQDDGMAGPSSRATPNWAPASRASTVPNAMHRAERDVPGPRAAAARLAYYLAAA